MSTFVSPLTGTLLGPMTARVGACRLGIARLGFFPKGTAPFTLPDPGDDEYYEHREVIEDENPHTEVLP